MANIVNNIAIKSNTVRVEKEADAKNIWGEKIEISFPVSIVKSIDKTNNPLTHVNTYTSNQKTIVQNIFNKRNLNEALNFKNTFYLSERGENANKETNTIYGYEKVYENEILNAGLKAQYAKEMHYHDYLEKEKAVKNGFKKTSEEITKLRTNEHAKGNHEAQAHKEEVRTMFKNIKSLVGVMVGTISEKEYQELKFHPLTQEEEKTGIEIYQIQKDTHDAHAIQENRSNIRCMLGSRSEDNQEKLRRAEEEKARLAEIEAAKQEKILKAEEGKISKYYDLKKLSKSWKIYDQEKLKGAIRNEIVKSVLKEEERKNFRKMGQKFRNNEEEREKQEEKKKNELKKQQSASPTKSPKKGKAYNFSTKNVAKLKDETPEDYNKRLAFISIQNKKKNENIDPVQRHLITKEFSEMIIKNAAEKNGALSAI